MIRSLPIIAAMVLMLTNCAANRPADANGRTGGLADCPDRPNCVSSLSDDQERFIAPLAYEGTMAAAAKRLVSVLEQMKGAKIVSRTDTAIQAEFTSTVFGFVDDVDFRFDAAGRRIDLRSASRVGYTDFGVNRRRIEEIRRRFQAAETTQSSQPRTP